MSVGKSFEIPKALVIQAYQQVKSNGGAAGVDNQSMEDFESDLKRNLYRIWNRMSSGTYFPPPVKAVPIPKKSGGTRILGVPTVSDRIAQTVVKLVLEPKLEAVFDDNSYGYRPGRSAQGAIEITRRRCWKYDWVVEFDIRGLFDNIRHDLLMKALRHHCDCKWILLYAERWLKAAMKLGDGTLKSRDIGTPQGGVISPCLANLFMHYAFDCWVRRELPNTPFCRYADDGLLHCKTEEDAIKVMELLDERLNQCGLQLHPDKSRIVYCKDNNRKENHPNISFDFLGYSFRPRRCIGKKGEVHPNFLPAISPGSRKVILQTIRSWHIQLKCDKSLEDLSKMFNPILRGWNAYYGRFYKTELKRIWLSFNAYLGRWVQRKYKRFAWHKTKAAEFLQEIAKKRPNLFVHWQQGMWHGYQ
ncbi:MAG: group II intron reverse transcriptase/maturase [Pseudobdellovibrionaceae bacterium]|nr:group II intron reverse transcriptase/maturase [Pseudobdellovibrionaceae bacterium]